jgi:CRISPR-associated protein Cas1
MSRRLFFKVTRENLPQVKDRYPFVYLERGRLEVDDSSVKWIDCDANVIRIPCVNNKYVASWGRVLPLLMKL